MLTIAIVKFILAIIVLFVSNKLLTKRRLAKNDIMRSNTAAKDIEQQINRVFEEASLHTKDCESTDRKNMVHLGQ